MMCLVMYFLVYLIRNVLIFLNLKIYLFYPTEEIFSQYFSIFFNIELFLLFFWHSHDTNIRPFGITNSMDMSIFWEIRKPGMLRSMGSQRIRHDLVTEQQLSLRLLWLCLYFFNLSSLLFKLVDFGCCLFPPSFPFYYWTYLVRAFCFLIYNFY